MKKFYLLFSILLLIIPIAFADITIVTDQNTYNLGNRIKVSASVMHDSNFEGLFKLAILCGNYKLEILSTTISLEANFRTAVNPLFDPVLTPQMLGDCAIKGDLLTNDNLVIDQEKSNEFETTDELIVLPVNTKVSALPGDSIKIAGVVNEAFGNNVLKASANINLDEISNEVSAADGKFSFDLLLPKDIKSGSHTIEITASDSKNNKGQGFLVLEVTPIPSYIKTELSKDNLDPGQKIGITSSLYDQADDLINVSLNLELSGPNKDKIFRKVVQSHESIEYEFSQYAEPGLYALSSTYNNLLVQSAINITEIRSVRVEYQNESVIVENTGNIPFEDEVTFILQNELNKIPITKKISILPGKFINIDLSKEAQLGIYDVLAPIKEGLGSYKEQINQSLNTLLNEDVLAQNVTIHDNRPIYKKVASGLSSLSTQLVGSNGLLAQNPLIAPLILIIILLALVVRYGRKPIMNLFKRKKENDGKKD